MQTSSIYPHPGCIACVLGSSHLPHNHAFNWLCTCNDLFCVAASQLPEDALLQGLLFIAHGGGAFRHCVICTCMHITYCAWCLQGAYLIEGPGQVRACCFDHSLVHQLELKTGSIKCAVGRQPTKRFCFFSLQLQQRQWLQNTACAIRSRYKCYNTAIV